MKRAIKTIQKWIQLKSKNLQNRGPEAPKSRPGGDQNRGTPSAQVVLDLGALLGWSRKRLEIVLEASWAVLGRERWPTWLQVGPQNGTKIEKIKAKNDQNFDASWGRFFKDFGGFGRAK